MTRNAIDLEVNRGLIREIIEKKINKANQPMEGNLQRVGPENLLEGINLRTFVIWGWKQFMKSPCQSSRAGLVWKIGIKADLVKGKSKFWVRDGVAS